MRRRAADAGQQLLAWGATCPRSEGVRHKFPRSSHLANLGAATSDDLLLDASGRALFVGKGAGEIRLEEKMDGGNIGISLAADEQFVFQKRAHHVNCASEPQYAQLQTWAEQHASELWSLLRAPFPWAAAEPEMAAAGQTPLAAPGQRILFGEWCAYQHTVGYDRLPDLFLAFDLFDASLNGGAGGFLSAERRNLLLGNTAIRTVRAVAVGRFPSVEAVTEVLEGTTSPYASAPTQIEGVYLRCDDPATGTLRARCKLVHPDFLQHIEDDGRWEKGAAKNGVRLDWWWERDNEGQLRSTQPEPEPEPEPEPQAEGKGAGVGRLKALYSRLRTLAPGEPTAEEHAELAQLAEATAAVLQAQPRQPFALLCSGWLLQRDGRRSEAEAALELSLDVLRKGGRAGATKREALSLLESLRGGVAAAAADPAAGLGLVRTLSQQAREARARAEATIRAEEKAEKVAAAELAEVRCEAAALAATDEGEAGEFWGWGAHGLGMVPRERPMAAVQCAVGTGWAEPYTTPKDLMGRWAASRGKAKVLEFYGETAKHGHYSNFYGSSFSFELPLGLLPPGAAAADFQTPVDCAFSEASIMLCKAAIMGDAESYACIAAARTPKQAKNLGRGVFPFDAERWHDVVCGVAREVCYQKFAKCPDLAELLLATGGKLMAEATRNDRVWGIGLDRGRPEIATPAQWRGSNVLGWALMQARARLRAEAEARGR